MLIVVTIVVLAAENQCFHDLLRYFRSVGNNDDDGDFGKHRPSDGVDADESRPLTAALVNDGKYDDSNERVKEGGGSDE